MAKKDCSQLEKDELIRIIERLESRKRYGLVWDEEKTREQFEKESENALPVLKEIKGKEIIVNPKDPFNILIEGDNYHSLSVLNYTHHEAIDVIYIDPPYNTGNKDFKYNDYYIDKEDGYRHSKWLAFMHKRIRLAKNLLSNNGVIFISIDDNEQAQLKLLCDEVFGENNFIDIFSWVKTETPANLSLKTKKAVEYILCYQKNRNKSKFVGLEKTSTSTNGLMNQTNAIKILIFPPNTVDTGIEEGLLKAGKYGTSDYAIQLMEDTEIKNGIFIRPVVLKGKFKWKQEKLNDEIDKGTKISIRTKALSPSYDKADYGPEVPWNLINRSFGVGTNESASSELKKIFGKKVFDFPKPVSLIKYLVNFVTKENKSGVILDFFAGTGTTGHAVLELNQQDMGKRIFILCTNDENGICTDVCLPRISKVIKGYKTSDGERIEGLKGNLKYFKTSFVKKTLNLDQMKISITNKCTEMLCLKEGIFDLMVESDDYKIFKQGNRVMAVYYSFLSNSLKDLKKKLDKIIGKKILYCFTLDSLGLDKNNFIGWDDIILEPIPQKILDIYEETYEY